LSSSRLDPPRDDADREPEPLPELLLPDWLPPTLPRFKVLPLRESPFLPESPRPKSLPSSRLDSPLDEPEPELLRALPESLSSSRLKRLLFPPPDVDERDDPPSSLSLSSSSRLDPLPTRAPEPCAPEKCPSSSRLCVREEFRPPRARSSNETLSAWLDDLRPSPMREERSSLSSSSSRLDRPPLLMYWPLPLEPRRSSWSSDRSREPYDEDDEVRPPPERASS